MADILDVVGGAAEKPTLPRSAGLLMALAGLGILLSRSLEQLPLRCVLGSLLLLGGGHLLRSQEA